MVLFFVVSVESSTVISSTVLFLTWYTDESKKKPDESPPFSSSFMARGASAGAFQSCPSDPMIRLRSCAASGLKAKGSMRQ